jgi:hypothetical protein
MKTPKEQMSDDCPICFEEIEDTNNVVITICRHKFHSTCLFRSVQSSVYRCPNCRGSLLSGPIASLLSGDSLYSAVTGATGATGAVGATGRAAVMYDISWNNINAMVQDAPTPQSSRQERTTGSYHNDSSDDITGG